MWCGGMPACAGLFDDVTEMISRHTPSLKRVEPPAGRVMSLPRDGSASVGAPE